jgi:sugar lactone lactonase YvrE
MKRSRSWKALATAGTAACLAFGGASAAWADQAAVALSAGSPFPESLTATADGTLFAGSLTHGGVVRAKPGSAQAEVWIKPGAFGTRSTFGVLADEANGPLWVCSNDASQLGAKGPTEIEGSFVKSFDLKTGEGRISVELPSRPAICNDMAIGPDKALYVSNTAQPQILRLAFGETKLEVWAQDDRLKGGLDGLAFGTDGALYANTFISGELFRFEVNGGSVGRIDKIETPRPLKLPDALKADGDGFLMVEGGGPLSRVTIADGKATLTMIKEFAGPTGLARVGDVVWVAEGQIVNLVDPSLKGQMPKSFQFRSTKADR